MGDKQKQERQQTVVWNRAVSNVGLVIDPSEKQSMKVEFLN